MRAAWALLLFGCDASERAARSEAAAVSHAVDTLRASADNVKKAGPLLTALRAEPRCAVERRYCAVKSYCVMAYERHVAVLGLIDEAKASIATAPAASVAAQISLAETGLSRAKTLTDDCATRQGEMARHYKVAR